MTEYAITAGTQGSGAAVIALIVGLAALGAAVGWRLVRLMRVRRGIAAGLRHEDPTVRSVAVQQAAEMGLASTAPSLLRAVRAETDPSVLAAVVRAMAARQ